MVAEVEDRTATRGTGTAALVGVLLATLVPVGLATAVGSTVPLLAAAIGVSLSAAVLGWVRHGSFDARDAGVVVVAAALAALSQPIMGAWTLAGGLGASSLLRARGIAVPWLSWDGRRVGASAPLLALALGLGLGAVNVAMFYGGGGDASGVGRPLYGLLDPVKAGLSEEIGMRANLLALCVYALGRMPLTRREQLLTYLVLTVPHAAIHFIQRPDQLVGGTIVLGVVFGLPLALLLKRCGLAWAVAAHVLIDAVRYLVVGL